MTTLLMCPPAKHETTASRQWERLVEVLRCAGDVEITHVEANASSPDQVFTANGALVCGKLAIVSTLRLSERRNEGRTHRAALARHGFATTFLQQTYFEGAGDALFDRRRPFLYFGYGWRSERSAAVQLGDTLGVRTLPLLLVDERLQHLDSALCPLSSGHVMACLDAFSPHGVTLLRRAIEPEYLIEVSIADALAFACNAVELNGALVLHDVSPKLRVRLNAAGYRIFATDLGDFIRAGGSAKSLTLKLQDGPACDEAAA